jgi:hypothetical protein
MTLSLPERLAMLMPPSVFYRRRIAQEARTGEPELAVLAELVPGAVLPSTSVQTLGSSPTPSPTSPIAFSPSNLTPTTPSSHVGCCAIAPRCTRLHSPTRPAVGPYTSRFSNRPFRVKRFQTIHHYSVDVASRARASLRNRHQGPFHHGIRGRGGTIFRAALP